MAAPDLPFGIPSLGMHFGAGYDGSRGPQSESLAESSARWSEAAQAAGTAPHSVLNQLRPSSNGLSARDAERQLPNGELLTANGQAQDSYDTGTNMLMRGVENAYNTPIGQG